MSIKIKLILIGAIALLTLGAVFLVNQVGSNLIDQSILVDEHALESEVSMLQARRSEKDFLARKDMKYVKRVQKFVAESKGHLATVAETDNEYATDATHGQTLLDDYLTKFMLVANSVKTMGLNDEDGLRGELRYVIHQAENVIATRKDDSLLAGMLQLRRDEKDFIIRGDSKFLDLFDKDMAKMQARVEASETLGFGLKMNIKGLLEDYQAAFHDFSTQAQAIESNRKAFTKVINQVEPLLEGLSNVALENRLAQESLIQNVMLGVEIIAALLLILGLVSVIRSILGPLGQLQQSTKDVANGDYDSCNAVFFTGELEDLRKDVVSMVESLKNVMDEAEAKSAEAEEQAAKAQQAMSEAHEEKERGELLMAKMTDVAARASAIAEQLTSASAQLSSQAQQITAGAAQQQERVGETATAMEEMNSTVLEVARNASDAAAEAEDASTKAREGATIVTHVIDASSEVAQRTGLMKSSLSELGEQAESIGTVMGVINDIADQTNLLALNAAIEAARAGEAGRGFAVVADEVRKLAEKTMQATKEVGTAITGIQEGTRSNIQAMNDAETAVTRSSELSSQAGESLQDILGIVETTTDRVRSIATAAEQQSATSEEINNATEEINRISTQTAEGMNESARSIKSLTALAAELQGLINELSQCRDQDAAAGICAPAPS